MNEAIQKYGWDNFEHKILLTNLSQEEAEQLEKQYIQLYNSVEHGFNTSAGGHTLPQESIQKMSQSLKQYYREHGHPWTGRKHTEETKEKIRQSKIGTKASDETKQKLSESHKGIKQSQEWIDKRMASKKKKVLCIESNIIYNSAKDCCLGEFGEEIKGTINDIRAVCRGERNKCKGKHFKYIEEGDL